jgi:hypothetical protein
MPPIKEFRFEDKNNPDVEIIIRAVNYVVAYGILIQMVKNPSIFKCTSI